MCRRILMRQYASSLRKDEGGYERQKEGDYRGLQRSGRLVGAADKS